MVKIPPSMQKTHLDSPSIPASGRSPGGGYGSYSSILAWRIPWTEEPGGLWSIRLRRVRHDKQLSTHTRDEEGKKVKQFPSVIQTVPSKSEQAP